MTKDDDLDAALNIAYCGQCGMTHADPPCEPYTDDEDAE